MEPPRCPEKSTFSKVHFEKLGFSTAGCTREAFRKTRCPVLTSRDPGFTWIWELVGGRDGLGPSISIRTASRLSRWVCWWPWFRTRDLFGLGIEVRKKMKIQGKSVLSPQLPGSYSSDAFPNGGVLSHQFSWQWRLTHSTIFLATSRYRDPISLSWNPAGVLRLGRGENMCFCSLQVPPALWTSGVPLHVSGHCFRKGTLRDWFFAVWAVLMFLRLSMRPEPSLQSRSYGKERLSCICWWSVEIFHGKRETSSTTDFSWQDWSSFPPKFLASVTRNWLAGFAPTCFPRHLLLACCWLAVVNLLSLTRVIQKSQNSEINSLNLVGPFRGLARCKSELHLGGFLCLI